MMKVELRAATIPGFPGIFRIITVFLFFVAWIAAIIRQVTTGKFGSVLVRMILAGGIFTGISWHPVGELAMAHHD